MLVMIVHGAMPIGDTDDKIRALMFLVVLFMWVFVFNFLDFKLSPCSECCLFSFG